VYGGTLNGCTLVGNSAAGRTGGGAYENTLNNCTLTGNSAVGVGCGAFGGRLNNCTITGNSVNGRGGLPHPGGGAAYSTLNNCTVTGNLADRGGGVGGVMGEPTLNNCIVYFNTANEDANYYSSSGGEAVVLNYCCTTPLPADGVGNITNEPAVDRARVLPGRAYHVHSGLLRFGIALHVLDRSCA
jgi:hypothetical protein